MRTPQMAQSATEFPLAASAGESTRIEPVAAVPEQVQPPADTLENSDDSPNDTELSTTGACPALRRKCSLWLAIRVAAVIALVVLVTLVLVDFSKDKAVIGWFESFLEWVRSLGAGGPFLYAAIYFVAVLCMIPASILTFGSGFIFTQAFGLAIGLPVAIAANLAGALTGSMAAFLISRYVFHDAVAAWAEQYDHVRAVDQAIQRQGLKAVALLRLSPVIPFGPSNYVLGVTSCTFPNFAIGNLAMIPFTAVYTYFGSFLGSVAQVEDPEGNSPLGTPAVQWTVLAVAIVTSIALAALLVWYARRQLNEILQEVEDEEAAEEEEVRDVEEGSDGGQSRPSDEAASRWDSQSRTRGSMVADGSVHDSDNDDEPEGAEQFLAGDQSLSGKSSEFHTPS